MYHNYREHHSGFGIFRIIAWVVLGLLTAFIFALVFGYFVQLLWNWLMPHIFKLGRIDYWEAFGLVLLARLIFGTLGHHSGHYPHHHSHKAHRHWKEWEKWNDSEWNIKGGWHNWSYYEEWWKIKGKESFEQFIEEKKIYKDNNKEEE